MGKFSMNAESLNRLTIGAFLSYISKVDGKQNSDSKGLTDLQKPFPIFFWRFMLLNEFSIAVEIAGMHFGNWEW